MTTWPLRSPNMTVAWSVFSRDFLASPANIASTRAPAIRRADGNQALSVYTHVSDQFSTFSSQVISCRKHESLYVLSGLLLNDTILHPQFHHTDTGGVTDHTFALCHLVGFEFMPRIKDLPNQSLFKLDRHQHDGELDCLFDATVSRDLVGEQWDQMVRLAVSLKNRLSPPEVVVERLASAAPADRLARALTAYGRIVKSIYILRYIQDEKLRRAVQLQLNRGEARHTLARWLFFANRGEFRDGDLNEIMNKTSCLSLLSNAAVVWNTARIQKIVDQLRGSNQTVRDEDLARIWPLLHEHILPTGIYDFASCWGLAKRGGNIAFNMLTQKIHVSALDPGYGHHRAHRVR